MKHLFLLFFSAFYFTSYSQELLKDINQSNASSHPRMMVDANGTQFFIAKGITTNPQLWKTDGTTLGTMLVKNPDYPSSSGPYLYSSATMGILGNKVVFDAYGYSPSYTGTELWISDGTPDGTQLLKDINPNSNSSYPSGFFNVGNKTFFQADNGSNGTELWVTDGTSSGTQMVKDINAGSASTYIYSQSIINNSKFCFVTSSNGNGTELWVSDGTEGGTFMLKDIYAGSSSSSPSNLTRVGNKVFFSAYSPTIGTELWVTDGTEAGTISLLGSTSPSNLIEFNGNLLFSSYALNTGENELWISDGTVAGTRLLKNISTSGSSSPQDLTKVGNTVFFTATNGINGRELWKTDGTSAGTVMIKDINVTSVSSDNYTFPSISSNRKFNNVNGILFFLANSGSEGFELWKSDGTPAGTTLVKDFVTGGVSASYNNFKVLGSKLYFSANDDTGNKYYWQSDGTLSGTIKFSNLDETLAIDNIYPLVVTNNNQFFFVAFNAAIGYELYMTDGNTIKLLKDIETNSHNAYQNFNIKIDANEKLIFSYNNNKNGNELWVTDGTPANTKMLPEFNRYPAPSIDSYYNYYSYSTYFENIVTFNGYTYFQRGYDVWRTNGETMSLWQTFSYPLSALGVFGNKLRFIEGDQLYESDGTNINLTTKLPNWAYNSYSSDKLYDLNGIGYFLYTSSVYGRELWKTDGTAAGTVLVKDITNGSAGTSFNDSFYKVGNKLFFTVYDSNGSELWVTDGTSNGTFMVKDIYPGNNSSYPEYLTNLNNSLLIFAAENGSNGREIWRSDGTASGTYMIADINNGSSGSYPSNGGSAFTVYNGKVYFGVNGNNSSGLYSTDGYSVTLVKSRLGNILSAPFDNQIYMQAYSFDRSEGNELWKSDGTALGTTLVKDIYSGFESSSPSGFITHKGILYFMATNGTYGNEPWILRSCVDSLHFASNMTGNYTYQSKKAIVGETANSINSTGKITYDAGKYVILNTGFSTDNGAVFLAKIGGCTSTGTMNTSANTATLSKTVDAKTEQYLKDLEEMPTIEQFIKYAEDKDLAQVWAKFKQIQHTLMADKEYRSFELENTVKAKDIAAKANNMENLATAQNDKLLKEQAYQTATEKAQQYTYFIYPVRDKKGDKTSYDLVINMGGEIYKASMKL